MASYNNSNYSNDFFDLTGVYFNSTSQTNSNINIDELDIRYLQKTGGTISNNLLINGSLDIQTSLTLPIGNITTLIESRQDIINDNDLIISNVLNLQTTLTNLDTNITENTSDITTLNKNNLIYNSKSYIIKTLSNWIERTLPFTGNWRKIIWVDELKFLIGINSSNSNNRMMKSTNGIDWENVVITPTTNAAHSLKDIVWSPELQLLVIIFSSTIGTPRPIFTSSDAITWTPQATASYLANNPFGGQIQLPIGLLISIAWSPELNLFVCITTDGKIISSPDGETWTDRRHPTGDAGNGIYSESSSSGRSIIWVSELNLFVAVYQNGNHRVFTSSNGINWTIIVVPFNAWKSVAWSPQLSILCAVASSGTGNRVMTSINGTNWVEGSISNYNWESIVWSDLGVFVAVANNGYLAYSTDGFNWIEKVLSGTLLSVSWATELSLFLVSGNNQLYTSSFKNRQPTNNNIFDSEFNSINENGEWSFKSLIATTIKGTNLIYGEDIDVEDKITSIETTLTGLDELTASHTTQISSNDTDITALQGRLDTEE